jgi:hypothetical protein
MSREHVHILRARHVAGLGVTILAPASATARPRAPPPSRGRCPTRSRRGAIGTGTIHGARWASIRSSGARAPAAAARAWAPSWLPPAAPGAGSPCSPAAVAAALGGTCRQEHLTATLQGGLCPPVYSTHKRAEEWNQVLVFSWMLWWWGGEGDDRGKARNICGSLAWLPWRPMVL